MKHKYTNIMGDTNAHIKFADQNDIDGIVQVHLIAFEDYFLTNLGYDILFNFYKEFIYNSHAIAIVAKVKTEVVGFIVATDDKANIFKNFYKKNFLLLAKEIIINILKFNKVIYKGILPRVTHISNALKAVYNGEEKKNELCNNTDMRLLSIAVLPEYSGKGISTETMLLFEKTVKQKGISSVGLSVKKSNLRAVNFYRKLGWELDIETGESLYFIKKL